MPAKEKSPLEETGEASPVEPSKKQKISSSTIDEKETKEKSPPEEQEVDQDFGAYTAEEMEVMAININIEKLYRDKIVRLNTASLFSEENWEGIKKIFSFAAKYNTSYEEIINKSASIKAADLSAKSKLDILDKLAVIGITFRLSKKDSPLDKKVVHSLSEDGEKLIFKYDDGKLVEIDLENNLDQENYAIRLNSQIYHSGIEMLLIDSHSGKCRAEDEFHEKMHLLDFQLVDDPDGQNSCSGQGFINFLQLNPTYFPIYFKIETAVKLTNVVVPPEVREYYLTKLGGDNKNIVSGLNEVFAFAMQRSAINDYEKLEPFLETISKGLDEIEVLILKSMVDSFQKEVSKKVTKVPELEPIEHFCKKFSEKLDNIYQAKKPKSTSPKSPKTSPKAPHANKVKTIKPEEKFQK